MDDISAGLLVAGLCGITFFGCLFLLWPDQKEAFRQKYAHSTSQRNYLFVYYIAGIWPLFQSLLFFFMTQVSEKVVILEITAFVFVYQCITIILDRLSLEKMAIVQSLSKQQVRDMDKSVVRAIMPNFFGEIICISIFVRISGFWTIKNEGEILMWLPVVCLAFYAVITVVVLFLLNWLRRRPIL